MYMCITCVAEGAGDDKWGEVLLVSSPSCHAPWAKDSLDNFKQFLGSAELASSENETTNQIALFAIRNSIT